MLCGLIALMRHKLWHRHRHRSGTGTSSTVPTAWALPRVTWGGGTNEPLKQIQVERAGNEERLLRKQTFDCPSPSSISSLSPSPGPKPSSNPAIIQICALIMRSGMNQLPLPLSQRQSRRQVRSGRDWEWDIRDHRAGVDDVTGMAIGYAQCRLISAEETLEKIVSRLENCLQQLPLWFKSTLIDFKYILLQVL